MNPVVKIVFLPIMLVAGVLTVAAMALINAPFALFHWLRERPLRARDLAAARAAREKTLREIYGERAGEISARDGGAS